MINTLNFNSNNNFKDNWKSSSGQRLYWRIKSFVLFVVIERFGMFACTVLGWFSFLNLFYLNRIVLIPCGHRTLCKSCGEILQKCPLCRAEITARIESY